MDLPTLHRVRSLAALLVGVLIAGLTLTGSIPAAHAANGTLSGTVTEAGTGVPLAGVSVEVFCWQVAGNDPGELCAETQTAATGTYSMSLAPGIYKVSFDRFPTHGRQFYGGGRNLGDATSLEVLVPDGGAVTGIGAALKPLRIASGAVTGNGGPVGGINVTAYQRSSEPSPAWELVDGVVTQPDGTYALHLTDGTYRVGFSDARGPYRTEFFDDAVTVEQADDVVVAGTAVSGINADLALNHAITGSVTVDGINMPGVTVTAFQADASDPTGWEDVKTTETGPDGSYALYLPDGAYRIRFQTFQARFDTVYYPGVSSIDAAADVVLAGADVPDISVAISSGEVESGPAITGTVTLSGTGAPAGGVAVTAYRWNVQGGLWAQVRQGSTAEDGSYALYVPEGTYRIGFSDFLGRYKPVFYGGADTVEEAADVVQTSEGVTGIDAQLVENHPYSASEGSPFWEQANAAYQTGLALTQAQRLTAMFWRDNPHTSGLPSGHWMQITRQVCEQQGLSLTESVEAYARAGVALHDAFLNCWTWKYRYNLIRPVDYVHAHIDPNWKTWVDTPHRSPSTPPGTRWPRRLQPPCSRISWVRSRSPTPTRSSSGAPARSTRSARRPRRQRFPGSTAASTTQWPSSSAWTRATRSLRW